MRIGVTGHQRLRNPALWGWVEEALSRCLRALDSSLMVVTSLAAGVDQRFARLVLARGGSVYAVIPFREYEATLGGGDLDLYKALLRGAEVEVMDTPGDKEAKYLAAGTRVVDLSERMVAVWDGKPARGRGGTGDIVTYTMSVGKPLIHINPCDLSVKTRGW